MTELEEHIKRLIRAGGPIPLSVYMGLALGHPEYGYYHHREVFGTEGDFITAPEISQMFGELIGLWCVQRWRDMGSPGEFILCELGPGRGTLMRDALRAARLAPDFLQAAQLHLVQTSRRLRALQREALQRPVIWHDGVTQLPQIPAIFIANEFFDALPIRQFLRRDNQWREKMVAIDPASDDLCFCLSPAPLADVSILPAAMRRAPEGGIAEISPGAQAVLQILAGHIAGQGGAALIIDYGPAASSPGDSFQALRGQRYSDPLRNAGHADLTAHVDFQTLALIAHAAGCKTDGPIPQGAFLSRLGLHLRARKLSQSATPEQRAAISSALHRLTGPQEMGGLFKALALGHPDLPLSPGFGE